jgi:DNA-binding protein H-NS
MPKVENLSRKAFDELAKRVEARKAQIAIDDVNRAAKKILAMMKSLSVDPAHVLQMLQNPGAKKPKSPAPATAKKSKKRRPKKAPSKAATTAPAKAASSPKKAVKKKASKKLPAKVANPTNPAQVWSLHGKQPQWYKDALKSGVKPEAMLIKKPAKKK